MKLQRKATTGIMILLVAFLFTVLPANAAGELKDLKAAELGKEQTVQADIDGDGVENSVKIYYTHNSEYYVQDLYVYVDGKRALHENISKGYVYSVYALYARSNEHDSCLQLYASGDNDYIYYNRLYQYNKEDGAFHQMLDLKKGEMQYSRQIRKVTKKGIVISNCTQPFEIGWTIWDMTYVWNNGSLKLASKEGKVTKARLKKYVTDRTITFYKEPGKSAKAFTLKKGKTVVLKKMKVGKKHLYAQFRYGKKTGWIKVGRDYSQVYKYDKNYKLIHEYFKGVQRLLAG